MPHLRIDYSPVLAPHAHMDALCAKLADTLASLEVFPLLGTRVLAYPAAHAAGHPFIYLNLRIAPGRSRDVLDGVTAALMGTIGGHFDPLEMPAFGLTLQIDETVAVGEGKYRRS